MTKAELEKVVVAWRHRYRWTGHHWPTENERQRAIKALEDAADEIIARQRKIKRGANPAAHNSLHK